jgi:hypothetical protein
MTLLPIARAIGPYQGDPSGLDTGTQATSHGGVTRTRRIKCVAKFSMSSPAPEEH